MQQLSFARNEMFDYEEMKIFEKKFGIYLFITNKSRNFA